MTTYIIERHFMKAAGFAMAGSVLTFFGLMHGEAVGIGQTPVVSVSYLAVAIFLVGCAKFAVVPAASAEEDEGEEAGEGMGEMPALAE
jgi:AGZA family xanthine/uracil permease-like MFS transporter